MEKIDVFAHRRLSESSKTLAALYVYPASSVGIVLRQLRSCLFDFRGIRNVRNEIVCVCDKENEHKNVKREREVKMLLLAETFLPYHVITHVTHEEEEQVDKWNNTETVSFVKLKELLLLSLYSEINEKTNNTNYKNDNGNISLHDSNFPSVLRDKLCTNLSYYNKKHNNNNNGDSYGSKELLAKFGETEVALGTFTIHFSYVNYTMPELLKMVFDHYHRSENKICTNNKNTEICINNCSSSSSNIDRSSQTMMTMEETEQKVKQSNGNNDNSSVESDAVNKEYASEECNSNTVYRDSIPVLSGFEQVGHIAHVNLAEKHLPFAYCIGQVILDCNPTIHVVVNKVESIATVFREFKMDIIALRPCAVKSLLVEYAHSHVQYGKNVTFVNVQILVNAVKNYIAQSLPSLSPEELSSHICEESNKLVPSEEQMLRHVVTNKLHIHSESNNRNKSDSYKASKTTFDVESFLHNCPSDAIVDALLTATVKQEGCLFTVPYNKVYWNSRLGHEHALLVSKMSTHDVLFDVMAGVGPFAIPAALRGLEVFANDLNPFAAAYMEYNRTANRLRMEKMHIYNMDGREFLKTLLLTELVKELRQTYWYKEHNEKTEHRQFHVVMNLPALAVTFLDVFAPNSEPWGLTELQAEMHTVLEMEKQKTVDALNDSTNCHYERNNISDKYRLHLANSQKLIDATCIKRDTEELQYNNTDIVERRQDTVNCKRANLVEWLQRKCVIHVYCFSSAEDVCADAIKQVETHIGYSLHNEESYEMCEARLVRDVSPLKRMICVSFSLPRLFW